MQVRHLDDPSPHTVVTGEVDADNCAAFADQLRAGGSPLHIDASGLTFIDSSGLSALLAVREEVHEGGGTFTMSGLTPAVSRVIEISGLLDQLGVQK